MYRKIQNFLVFVLLITPNILLAQTIKTKPIDDFTRIGMSYQPFISFNIVGIVHFKGVISEKIFRQALDVLQDNHTFLQVHITNDGKSFTTENAGMIPFTIQSRSNIEQWKTIVDSELHTPFDVYASPLI